MIVRIQFSALNLEQADSVTELLQTKLSWRRDGWVEIQVGVGSIVHFVMFYQFVFYEASFPDTHEIATKLAVLDTIASLYGIIDASMCTKSD